MQWINSSLSTSMAHKRSIKNEMEYGYVHLFNLLLLIIIKETV